MDIEQSEDVKALFECAHREANRLNHQVVSTGHLLVALAHSPSENKFMKWRRSKALLLRINLDLSTLSEASKYFHDQFPEGEIVGRLPMSKRCTEVIRFAGDLDCLEVLKHLVETSDAQLRERFSGQSFKKCKVRDDFYGSPDISTAFKMLAMLLLEKINLDPFDCYTYFQETLQSSSS